MTIPYKSPGGGDGGMGGWARLQLTDPLLEKNPL